MSHAIYNACTRNRLNIWSQEHLSDVDKLAHLRKDQGLMHELECLLQPIYTQRALSLMNPLSTSRDAAQRAQNMVSTCRSSNPRRVLLSTQLTSPLASLLL